MAQKKDVRYIQFYTDGNAARVLEPAPEKKVSLPQAPQRRQQVIHLDLLAVGAIAMAVLLLCTMLIGLTMLRSARQDRKAMEGYVLSLRNESVELSYEYNQKVDLDKIQSQAISQGMIPMEEAYRIPITVTAPEQEETSVWSSIGAFFTGLFA